MEKVLVSACLLGAKVRYHGGSAEVADPALRRLAGEGRLVPICPEVDGGLPTPRPPAEIRRAGADQGGGVRLRVVTAEGRDVSAPYHLGADSALAQVRREGIRLAILKDGSPSCGSTFVYDGTFTGTRTAGEGLTASRLRAAGVRVFDETQIAEAVAWLSELERR